MARRGLTSWVYKLSQQDMPVVGEVISELGALAGRDDVEVNQLAEVILRDPNLTSHVLRIANSVHYNYSSYPITTVSRAIVLIGFKAMRAICISSLIIENFLKKGPREILLNLMARGLHAATQARSIMLHRGAEQAEEVFIAALLYHLGEMAFWASDSEPRPEEVQALTDPNAGTRKEAMERVLGTSFKAITLGLAKQWRLGETLEKSLYPAAIKEPTVQAVLLGEKVSRAAPQGWSAPETLDVIGDVAKFIEQDVEQTQSIVQENAEMAVSIAKTYGTEAVSRLIPGKGGPRVDKAANDVAADVPRALVAGDPELQLNILRELSLAAEDIGDVNTVIQMVVEGMHRGIGLPRVAVGFVRNDRLQAKYVLGDGTDHWRDRFNFALDRDSDNLFAVALRNEINQWLGSEAVRNHPEWHPPIISQLLGRHEAFVGLLRLGTRIVGMFYADAKGLVPLTQQQYDSFRHFVSQAQMNLMILSQRRVKSAEKRMT
jgi:HD-like signal output (HDOD) protein